MARKPTRLPIYPIGTTGVTDVINLEDDEQINFGSGSDARIYYDGTDLKIEPDVAGSGNVDIVGNITFPADDDGISLGAADDVKLSWDGTNFIIAPLSGNNFGINFGANITTIYGGHETGDDITIACNSVDTNPRIAMEGNASIAFFHPANQQVRFYEATTEILDIDKLSFDFQTSNKTGSCINLVYAANTTTGNIVALDLDAATNLTMGTNFGVTGLKITVDAANGSGESFGIDLSGVPNTEIMFKYLPTSDTVTANIGTDAAANWLKLMSGTTAYYVAAWTIDGS